MLKKILITFSIHYGINLGLRAQNLNDSVNQESADTSKIVLFLDGKRISQKILLPMIEKGSVQFIGGEWSSRQSIMIYGEAYRYGVNFFVTKTPPNTES